MPRGTLAAGKRHCSVYIMQAGSGPVKIGRAYDPSRRRSGVQTGSAGAVELIHHWRTKAANAVRIEGELHKLFRPLRKSGEWFGADPADVLVVGDLLFAGLENEAHALAAAIIAAEVAYRAYERHEQSADRRSSSWRRLHQLAHDTQTPILNQRWHDAEEAAMALGRLDGSARWDCRLLSPKGKRVGI